MIEIRDNNVGLPTVEAYWRDGSGDEDLLAYVMTEPYQYSVIYYGRNSIVRRPWVYGYVTPDEFRAIVLLMGEDL